MLTQNAPRLLRTVLPKESHPALVEILPYFVGSFGSAQRLDYGTGHELSFAAFLCTFLLLRVLDPLTDSIAIALIIFPKYSHHHQASSHYRYFALIRRLIETYTLEPAGSHGVWGLDDTSFLPFLFGSGQVRDDISAPPPSSITQPAVVQLHKDRNLYFDAVAWINRVDSTSSRFPNSDEKGAIFRAQSDVI
jgi:serine/threonine-protein phosphatase 2A activator